MCFSNCQQILQLFLPILALIKHYPPLLYPYHFLWHQISFSRPNLGKGTDTADGSRQTSTCGGCAHPTWPNHTLQHSAPSYPHFGTNLYTTPPTTLFRIRTHHHHAKHVINGASAYFCFTDCAIISQYFALIIIKH